MFSYGPPHMAEQNQDGQLEHTYSSSVRIRDVALKTCQRRWTIGRRSEKGSGISVLTARHDDDDDWFQYTEESSSKNCYHLTQIWKQWFAHPMVTPTCSTLTLESCKKIYISTIYDYNLPRLLITNIYTRCT